MKLRDIFESYSKDELKMICRSLNISGFGKQDKPYLVELLYRSLNNREFFMELIGSLSDSCLYFESLIINATNKEMADFENFNLQTFSKHTFVNNLKKLYTIGTIFIGEDESEKAFLIIPDEFEPWMKEFLADNQIMRSKLQEIEKRLLEFPSK